MDDYLSLVLKRFPWSIEPMGIDKKNREIRTLKFKVLQAVLRKHRGMLKVKDLPTLSWKWNGVTLRENTHGFLVKTRGAKVTGLTLCASMDNGSFQTARNELA